MASASADADYEVGNFHLCFGTDMSMRQYVCDHLNPSRIVCMQIFQLLYQAGHVLFVELQRIEQTLGYSCISLFQ
jgi:hypothetical protein